MLIVNSVCCILGSVRSSEDLIYVVDHLQALLSIHKANTRSYMCNNIYVKIHRAKPALACVNLHSSLTVIFLSKYKLEIRGALHRCTTSRNGERVNIYLQTMRISRPSDSPLLQTQRTQSVLCLGQHLLSPNHIMHQPQRQYPSLKTKPSLHRHQSEHRPDPRSKIHYCKQIHISLSLSLSFQSHSFICTIPRFCKQSESQTHCEDSVPSITSTYSRTTSHFGPISSAASEACRYPRPEVHGATLRALASRLRCCQRGSRILASEGGGGEGGQCEGCG